MCSWICRHPSSGLHGDRLVSWRKVQDAVEVAHVNKKGASGRNLASHTMARAADRDGTRMFSYRFDDFGRRGRSYDFINMNGI
jgi:hypothetical protein